MGSDAVFVQGTFPSFIDVRPSASRARLEILFSSLYSFGTFCTAADAASTHGL